MAINHAAAEEEYARAVIEAKKILGLLRHDGPSGWDSVVALSAAIAFLIQPYSEAGRGTLTAELVERAKWLLDSQHLQQFVGLGETEASQYAVARKALLEARLKSDGS
jgi:hypothetical protein